MKEKIEFIHNLNDNHGNTHSVFVMKIQKVDGNWTRVFKYGNLTYASIKDVKEVINEI